MISWILLGRKAIALMALQALVQLAFRNLLNLAQEFMRNLANLVAITQFVFQMGHKAGGHFRVGQCAVSAAGGGQLGEFDKDTQFVARSLRQESPRNEHGAGKLLTPS